MSPMLSGNQVRQGRGDEDARGKGHDRVQPVLKAEDGEAAEQGREERQDANQPDHEARLTWHAGHSPYSSSRWLSIR